MNSYQPQIIIQNNNSNQGNNGKSGIGAVAAIASFFMPGLGQLIQGRLLAALFFFFAFWITIWFVIGILFWIWSIVDAAKN